MWSSHCSYYLEKGKSYEKSITVSLACSRTPLLIAVRKELHRWAIHSLILIFEPVQKPKDGCNVRNFRNFNHSTYKTVKNLQEASSMSLVQWPVLWCHEYGTSIYRQHSPDIIPRNTSPILHWISKNRRKTCTETTCQLNKLLVFVKTMKHDSQSIFV